MTIGTLNHTATRTAEGIGTASPAMTIPLPGFNGEPVDIHSALEEVKRLPEFQPPQVSPFDEWLQKLWSEKLFKEMGQALEKILKSLDDVFSQIRPEGMPHLPENIQNIFSGFIGFLLILAGLYALYLLLTVFLRWKKTENRNSPGNSRFFEQTPLINAAYHYQQAHQAADMGNYREGIRALYMATLCLLDENRIMPYEPTRTNLEYQRGLTELSRLDLRQGFGNLARQFEGIRYGNQPAGLQQFQTSRRQYQHFQEQLAVPHG
jgi:hypothetical protein